MSRETTTVCDLCGKRVKTWRPDEWFRLSVSPLEALFATGGLMHVDVCSTDCLFAHWDVVSAQIARAEGKRDAQKAIDEVAE